MRYDTNVEIIDESRPMSELANEVTSIWIDNPERRPRNEEALREVLRLISQKCDVRKLIVKPLSLLETAWPAGLFPNLETVFLFGRSLRSIDDLARLGFLRDLVIDSSSKKRRLAVLPRLPVTDLGIRIVSESDVRYLGECTNLRSLSISGWPLDDLRPLSALQLQRMKVLRGTLARAEGLDWSSVGAVHFAETRLLGSIRGVDVPEVILQSCPNLDVLTIGGERLRDLTFEGAVNMPTFSFVRACPNIVYLDISGPGRKTLATTDFSPLTRSGSLRSVTLCFKELTSEAIKAMSLEKPDLLISNGKVGAKAGQVMDLDRYFELVRNMEAMRRSETEPRERGRI